MGRTEVVLELLMIDVVHPELVLVLVAVSVIELELVPTLVAVLNIEFELAFVCGLEFVLMLLGFVCVAVAEPLWTADQAPF